MASHESQKWNQVVCGIEHRTGLRVTELRDMDISALREHLDAKFSKPLSFYSAFPVIGRGNVLRDSLIDTATLNDEIDKILSCE